MNEDPRRLWSLGGPAPAVLIAMRCLACQDAGAQCARRLLQGQFGDAHLKIFVLTQLLMARLSDGAHGAILLATPCSQGLTPDETEIVGALAAAAWGDCAQACGRLAALVEDEAIPPALEVATALGEALRDAGCPVLPREAAATVH